MALVPVEGDELLLPVGVDDAAYRVLRRGVVVTNEPRELNDRPKAALVVPVVQVVRRWSVSLFPHLADIGVDRVERACRLPVLAAQTGGVEQPLGKVVLEVLYPYPWKVDRTRVASWGAT